MPISENVGVSFGGGMAIKNYYSVYTMEDLKWRNLQKRVARGDTLAAGKLRKAEEDEKKKKRH